MRKVEITGIGLLSPTGNDLATFWSSLLTGRSGVRRITRFDASSFSCQIGGEVEDLSYENVIEPRKLRTSTHATQLALAAAEFALRDARLPRDHYDPDMMGVSLGTALGGTREAEQQHAILIERGARRVNPFVANGTPNHAPAAEVAAVAGARGPHSTFSSGCCASLQAISHGAWLVASGQADACLVGGTESPLAPMVIAGMARTQELCPHNDFPERASRPFDRDHAGIVLSEGSCILLLESADNAARRGASSYAEILGAASSCDAGGLYGIDHSGRTGARAVHQALRQAGLVPADIDYVCAHANSSPLFDRKETIVIKAAFGEWAPKLPISSIKAVLGHPFGASGAFQVATAAAAIQHQTIPPTHNLEVPDPECDLDYVPNVARGARIGSVLVTSYGYGGLNSYLVIHAPTSHGFESSD